VKSPRASGLFLLVIRPVAASDVAARHVFGMLGFTVRRSMMMIRKQRSMPAARELG
jgi:hypothetical protein